MKKLFIAFAAFSIFTSIYACRDQPTKEVIREVEVEKPVEIKETPEKREGILERAGQRVDDNVNKKIDDQIDKIGDGN